MMGQNPLLFQTQVGGYLDICQINWQNRSGPGWQSLQRLHVLVQVDAVWVTTLYTTLNM